jgi:hypothetical protein
MGAVATSTETAAAGAATIAACMPMNAQGIGADGIAFAITTDAVTQQHLPQVQQGLSGALGRE